MITVVDLMKILMQKQTEVSEFLLGLAALLWGAWLLNPAWNTFYLFSYTSFLHIASENVWGIALVVIGIVAIIASTTKWFKVRRLMALIQLSLWAFVAVTFASSAPQNTSIAVYIVLSLAAFWAYIKIIFLEFAYKN